MTVIVKPIGRGNWGSLTMIITGSRAQPFSVSVGDRFTLAGVTWRVVSIAP